MSGGAEPVVFVETAARLHFGVLDLRGSRGRWFGGIGAAAPSPALLLSASCADSISASGDDADRAAAAAQQFLRSHGVDGGATIHVHRALPSHAGLGSGTQLSLAVARALAELYALPSDAPDLARAVGRARRSAVGTWTFAGGGLVVEGGRAREGDGCGPLVVRMPFPPTWRCTVAIPAASAGLSGHSETAAFAALPLPPETEVQRVAYLTLLSLLPALADSRLDEFGTALTEIQAITGGWFAPVQGGTYAPGASAALVHLMAEHGAAGVGQSSWGPTVYGIVDGVEASRALARTVAAALGNGGNVFEGPFRAGGARVWRAASHDLADAHPAAGL